VLELYKRAWQVFIPAFIILIIAAGTIYTISNGKQVLISLVFLFLSIIALILGIIWFIHDWRTCKKEERDSKNKDGYPKLW